MEVLHLGKWFQKLNHSFDLIIGKANEVDYQAGRSDAFYHKYTYDGENRLTDVKTINNILRETQID